jgi:ubiquinone/menaquinone biosynthesis C-methylase UbiE
MWRANLEHSVANERARWRDEDDSSALRRAGRVLFNNAVIFEFGSWLYTAMTTNPIWLGNSARLLDGAYRAGEPCRVLDLGAGPGTSALAMGDHRPDAAFIAIDLAAPMLNLAQRNRQSAGWSQDRLALVQGDALALPLPPASVDVVTGHSFLYLLPNPLAVLCEARRVLRSGGHLAFLEPHTGPPNWRWLARQPSPGLQTSLTLWRFYSWLHRRFSPITLTALLSTAGFSQIITEVTLGGFGLFARARKS